ncbi:uncharacterized protein LOC110252304 isoform X2 [Exaiptasia diaphana]|uniref:Uncharacterized protein n=1 Tax=Exaiptasia diaphana TaxID=2652724 RepID=A0A913Y649_EXADI|nr:uncharacterized protein LOC110252304 isoform X2 [Exaiptasia diaphana]
MAAKRVANDERKFVSLLTSKLKKGNHTFEDAELDLIFGDALSNLPDSDLKSGLKKHYETHLKKLKSVLLSKKLQEESATERHTKFIFFNEQDIDKVINEVKTSKSDKEKNRLFKGLWSSYPLLEDSQKIFTSLEDVNGLLAIEKCIHNTVGCFNKKNVLECLGFLLRVFSRECEACLTGSQESKCSDLASRLQRSIVIMNQRWHSGISMSPTGIPSQEESFEDLMAAMLSLYTDLLSNENNDDSVIEKLASLMTTTIGHSPEHCMDAMLQITKPNERLLSLFRCILERNKGHLTHKQYIKFICLARLALKVSSLPDKRMSILKITENQRASPGFVAFLQKSNGSLVERLKITKKMTPSQLTASLLGDLSEDDVETFLDIATEHVTEDTAPEENEETDVTQANQTCDSQLFFIDSSGDVEDTEIDEVKVEENKARDSLLHKQMKAMMKEAQESESEDEDMFDEELSSMTKDLVESSDKDENEEKELSLKVKEDVNNSTENKDVERKTPLQPLRRSTRKSIKNDKLSM